MINNVFRHKCCSCKGSAFNRGLTKLWHIAIHKKLLQELEKFTKNNDGAYDTDSVALAGAYDKSLVKDIPDTVAEKLDCCKNFSRSIIPYILLFLIVTMMCLAYLTFDLHLLACITEPEEELIMYKANRVEINFSFFLLIFQKVGAILVCILGILLVILAGTFFYCTETVIDDLIESVEVPQN